MPDQLTINWEPPANFFLYNADLYCPPCASDIEHDLIGKGFALCQGMNDSNSWPQEYSSIGVGETDSPDHCGNCQRFLGRDLTEHGAGYVKQAAIDELARDGAIGEVVQGWLDYYEIDLDGSYGVDGVCLASAVGIECECGPEND